MKPKCVFFVGYYPILTGGAEYQSKIIADNISQYFDVVFISVDHDKSEQIINDRYKIYKIKIDKPKFHKITFYYFFMKRVYSILRDERPDFVYQRVLNSFSPYLAKYLHRNQIPFFLHIADVFSLRFSKFSISSVVRRVMLNITKNNNPAVIVQTEEQRERLISLGITPVLKINNFHPKPLGDISEDIRRTPKRVVWVGNARKEKQLEKFVELSNMCNDELEFHFIGGIRHKESAYGKRLQSLLSNNSNIIWHGEKDNKYVNDFLYKSFLLVNTSFSEGFSNTFIQAWMRGIPVISLNSNPDGIFDSIKLGFFCDNNFDKMKYYIKKFVDDPELYNQYSKESTMYGKKHFCVEYNIDKFVQLFQKSIK